MQRLFTQLGYFAHQTRQALIEFCFPASCIHCDHLLENYSDIICSDCKNLLIPLDEKYRTELLKEIQPAHFDHLLVCYEFNKPFQELVHLLKYQRYSRVALLFAEALLPFIDTTYDLVTAVPLNAVRLRERGYNQSALIATALGKQTGLKDDVQLLERTRNTGSQTKLNRQQRIENMRNVFYCVRDVAGKRILIIDDVITTGSTLNACAAELKRNRAQTVDICALATPVSFFQRQLENTTVESEPGDKLA